jgi:hypothetical protein
MRMHGPKVSVRDLDQRIAEKLPNAADGLPYPLPTEPPHIGATAKQPAPQRDMWADERSFPWLLVAYVAAVLLGAFLPHLIAGAQL